MADEEEAVGDSSRNVLRNIQAAARELMRIAVHCSINAAGVEEQESSLQLPTTPALKKLGNITRHQETAELETIIYGHICITFQREGKIAPEAC